METSDALFPPDFLEVDFLWNLVVSFSFHDNQVIHKTVPLRFPLWSYST